MEQNEKWLQWAVELQSLAQAGIHYTKDPYDEERFERIREIAAEMIAHKSEIPLDKVKDLFCCEIGYQTPKLEWRASWDCPAHRSWRRGRRSFRTAKSCWSRRTTASGPCPEAGVT